MAITLSSYNQILGAMIRKIIAETPLNDINTGSVLLSLLEAAATNDFENNVAILNILELLNIDAIKNSDLDMRAADYGLSRKTAVKASGYVTIYNENITKQSTNLYVIKPAPISGQTILYVNDTTGWTSSGTLYIGRGTSSFEGPIPYTSLTVYPTFTQINLGSALQKDHLLSDTVINSQGEPDRIVSAGTVVKIPANNQNPEVKYVTLRDVTLPSGEDSVDNVQVIAQVAGSLGNATMNTITQFDTLPFSGAAVSNTSSFTSGKDIETDIELRNRIKTYTTTLARGTAPAIVAAVLNVSDPDDNKQVTSAAIIESTSLGEPSTLYIDDGTGFQPSYAGQSVDVLLSNANGTEQFLQLSNFPLPRPQVVNTAEGPFAMSDSMFLNVAVDGEVETITFSTSDFVNISAATVTEIITSINDNATTFKARLTNDSNNVLIYPTAFDAEIIQVMPLASNENTNLYANSVLSFPTNTFSYISLYQNSTRLFEKNKSATVETVSFGSWNIIAAGNLVIAVDGTPTQNAAFTLSDFSGATSFASLSLSDWATAINSKIAGITAVVTSNETLKISSNKTGSASSVVVSSGSYLSQMFGSNNLSSTGQTAQFELNRQTGNLKVLTTIAAGDSITAGSADDKGFVASTVTMSGTYNVANDSSGRPAEMVIVADCKACDQISVPLTVGTSITVTDQTNGVMRLMSNTLSTWSNTQPGNFIYISKRTAGTGWFNDNNTGLFKVIKRGSHLTALTDSYIEVLNANIVAETATVADVLDIKAFSTDGYPQIWRGVYTTNPPAATLSDVVASFDNILGITANIFRSNSIKITSTTENGGSIAIPVSAANAGLVFAETNTAEYGNPSHAANSLSNKELIGLFKRSQPTSTNVWLDRHTYTDISGSLTASAIPDSYPFSGTYSEVVQSSGVLTSANVDYSDILAFTDGNNKTLTKSIQAKIAVDSVGTQQGTIRTELDHIVGDEFSLMQSLRFAADDNAVFVLDKNADDKTIDIKMARTGQVNSGSSALSFLPTSTEFSANDYDNETGIDFGNLNVWGTSINDTDFSNYAILMRSRNWYSTGGVSGTGGKMIVRNAEYGASGNSMQFAIKYPDSPNLDNSTIFTNTPSANRLTYYFGSGSDRALSLATNTALTIQGPYPDTTTNFPGGATSAGNYFDYTFASGTFGSVLIGDVLSIASSSGVSSYNIGQFSVANISGNTVRVFNPNASVTIAGTAEVTTITTIADTIGTPTSVTINLNFVSAAALDGRYFVVYDNAGSVKIWFDVDNNGTAEPISPVYNRTIKIATLITGDTATTVSSKIQAYLMNDPAFTNIYSTATQILYQLSQNGPASSPFDGTATTGFTFVNTPGVADQSLNGKYFTIYDDVGSVSVWFDVGSVGTEQPFDGADRSIKVSSINQGDSATTVAAAIANAVNADSKFVATYLSNQITITTAFTANVPPATANTSGFTVSSVNGSSPATEIISNTAQVHIFPLTKTAVSDIVTLINAGTIMSAAAVGSSSLTITKSTTEDVYSYAGNSTALGYGHNPGSVSLRDHINLYDGINWVKSFANTNPNFTLKTALTLNGVAPSVYAMNSAPNEDSTNGEYIKLVPTTVKNVHHHFTQKALSQLPIVSSVDIAESGKNIQIKSLQLGSLGAVEVVGGQANEAQTAVIGESEVTTDTSGTYLACKISAFPNSFSADDIVKIFNVSGVKRLSRLASTDTIDVVNPSLSNMDYRYNAKTINFTSGTTVTITDVSATYGKAAGLVWRWTHGGGGATLADVVPGDLVCAYGTLSGWAQGNKARTTGDANIAGLPIINVNDSSNWFDVVNPYGKAMTSTAIGTGNVKIFPTPIIKWNLNHAAPSQILAISRTGSTVTVTCATAHFLNTADSVSIVDSTNIPDGVYTSVIVTSNTTFTFVLAGSSFTETAVGATAINASSTNTRYKMQRLGINGLTRLTRYDGKSPRFADCGVAVDDYVVINGNTFSTSNRGIFRVLGVENDSILFINENSVDDINTIKPFNNKNLLASWTANSALVTGAAGTFKNVSVGDWVKKSEDADAAYLQVTAMSPVTPSLATQITLGGNYSGITGTSAGTTYNQVSGANTGVYLHDMDDVVFYEGDSACVDDTLFIQNIVNANWFSINNAGSFTVTEFGTDGISYSPFLRISNSGGTAQAGVQMSVSPTSFYIVEGETNKFYSYRKVFNSPLDGLNESRRILYLEPSNRQYKFSEANNTYIANEGKLGFDTTVVTGIDGYLYYTGLLRRIQRIVDGFEPDAQNFPGRRAVGGSIEILPPLARNIEITVTITTNEGVNVSDVSSNVKSAIIDYVNGLGVGADVILSEIIANIMHVKGIAAVTFNYPTPDTERITISKDEKATILPENIRIA